MKPDEIINSLLTTYADITVVEAWGETSLSKGCVIQGDWDFTAVNQLTPHPVYGWMSWVAVNNPSVEMFNDLTPYLDAAYQKAIAAFKKR